MIDFLVLKDATYQAKRGGGTIAGLHELNLLAPGAVCIVAGETIVTAATTVANLEGKESFTVYVGVDTGDALLPSQYTTFKSGEISRSAFGRSKRAYTAPAAKVVAVGTTGGAGLSLPGTLTVGSIAMLRITRNTQTLLTYPAGTRVFNQGVFSDVIAVEHVVASGDNQATIVDSLVAKVNAHPNNQDENLWVTAAALGTPHDAIQLTGALFQDFSVQVDEIIVNATRTTTTNLKSGSGYWTQVAEQELLASAQRRNTSQTRESAQHWRIARQTVSGETYTQYSFNWNAQSRQGVGGNANTWDHACTVAVPSGATTLITALDTIFGVLMLDTSVFGSSAGDNI